MNRTVRIVSVLRWVIVAMHTAMVLSAGIVLAALGDSRSDRIASHAAMACLMLPDLPVAIVMLIPLSIVNGLTPAIRPWLVPTIFLLFGGLQWYWITGLLVRFTVGSQRTVAVTARRVGIVLGLGVVLVGGCAVLPWSTHLQRTPLIFSKGPYAPPAVSFSGDSKDLRHTVVVPTLDTPMPRSKNVIWCGALQLAWNRLEKDVLHEPPQVQGAETVASRLNQAEFCEDDLPADSYLATAGFAKDGIAERVTSEMARRFRKEVDLDSMEPNDILAYAYLEANAAFTIPFFDNRDVFHFFDSAGKDTKVSSFGIKEKHEYAYEALREQLGVLYVTEKRSNPEEPEEFAIDLCRDSSPSQVVIARIPPKTTLLEMLKDVENKTQEFARQPNSEYFRKFGVRDVLLVPNLNWELRHRFTELEGRDKRFLNTGFSRYYIAKAMQTIRFKLDRSGVELASEAQVLCKPMANHFVCDGPFLIVVKKRGAERPFFVMWVGNAELLCRSDGGEGKGTQ